MKGASATDRIASTYYSGLIFTFDVTLTGGPHQVALYLLDLDSNSRAETISILDAESNRVLDTLFFSNFHNGAYAVWTLQGHILIKVSNYGGLNAVVSGLFFGPAPGVGVPGPLLNITNPTPGSLSGTVNVTAYASALAGVASLQFQLDGTNFGPAINATLPALFSWNTTSASNWPHSLTAFATDNLGQRTTSAAVAITVANVGTGSSAAATFVKLDAATGGAWTAAYGGDGYIIANGVHIDPAYAAPRSSGASLWTWAESTTDPRALQRSPAAGERIASTYYSGTTFDFDVNLTDGHSHQVALYCLDMDSAERAQTVSILDAGTHAVLDSRNITNFHNGVYAVWNLQGHVVIQVTSTGGINAAVSGVFFGTGSIGSTPPPSSASATFVRKDVATLGTWKGRYGQDGQIIANDANNPPIYVAPTWTGASPFTWSITQDPRALQQATGVSRTASAFYSSPSFSLDLNFSDGNAHQVALYFLDWDDGCRAETVTIRDAATQQVLDTLGIANFQQGAYLIWNVSGHVTVQFQASAGLNAVVSGVFLGPPQ